MNIHRLLISFMLLAFTTTLVAQIPEDCADRQQTNGWPEYYCDCKYNYQNFTLPLDIQVSESVWFKGNINELAQGISAYLHSDCEFSFEVYISCTAKEPRYQAVFAPNVANTVDGSIIKRKLEEEGFGQVDASFYICITPINGLGGRLIMRSEADGMPSSCDDPLYIFPGMSLYSTQPTDVYVIDPSNIEEATDIIIHWDGDNNTPCELQITSNSCDGAVVDDVTLDATNNCYTLTAELLDEAWFNDEKFYLHFNHAPNTAGFVHCLVPEYTTVCTDTTICQGMGIQLADTLLTESTTYSVDTVFLHTNQYRINCLNVTVVEPEPQPDTLGLKSTQLPYLYRSQHTIIEPGNYDITIHTLGQCDERYLLHVYLDVDTIVHERDTLMCYGGIFEYKGNKYTRNTTFEETSWYNPDTLLINKLHLYFATTPDIVHDTIMQYQRKYNKFFSTIGDVHFLYANPETHCTDSIIMHVIPSAESEVKYDYFYEDYTLCQGMTFTHPYFSGEYTSSTVLVDSFQVASKRWEITVVTVTFTAPEIVPDTLSLKTTELPYLYKEQYLVEDFGEHDVLITAPNTCDERYALHVSHRWDTITHVLDTFLCYGSSYVHDSQVYVSDTSLVVESWPNENLFQVDVINLLFASLPEQVYDTLVISRAELPYLYREQPIDAFGAYEFMLANDQGCVEQVLLWVEELVSTALNNTPLYDRPRLIMRGGVVYVLRGSEMFTLLGEKL